MPSFDLVSEVDIHELSNAIDQANREINTRYDLKGTSSVIENNQTELVIKAPEEFQIEQILEILRQKLTKRGIDILCLKKGQCEKSTNQARLPVSIQHGIPAETAKKITQHIKQSKLKVQISMQGERIRVSGKKRDDLQSIISLVKDCNWGLPIQYENFRD
ncbi:MAG: YajQ family cyclic di-GMP-binding protein [Pseudomonadota bacterium]